MFLGSSGCVRESGSPFFFFFLVCHTVSVTTILAFLIIIEEEWRKKNNISESSVSHWLCVEPFFFLKGGSVIFGFYLVSVCHFVLC